jgi:hypothetical protein
MQPEQISAYQRRNNVRDSADQDARDKEWKAGRSQTQDEHWSCADSNQRQKTAKPQRIQQRQRRIRHAAENWPPRMQPTHHESADQYADGRA